MKSKILFSESFSFGGMTYFLDIGLAINGSYYFKCTRSDLMPDGTYKRTGIVVFEDALDHFIQAFSSLLSCAATRGKEVSVQDLFNQKQEDRDRGIKSWPPELRPREKLLEHGVNALSNAELLALLVLSGTPEETAVDLGRRILDSLDGKLSKLADLTHVDLCQFNGMGIAKSSSIIAAMELGKRALATESILKQVKMATGMYGAN